MPNKLDFFSCIHLFGGCASRFDWHNHCIGSQSLMRGKDAPLSNVNEPCSCVRHPDNIGYGLDVMQDDSQFEAYDEEDLSLSIPLTWQDANLWELRPMDFAKWLQNLLRISGKTKPRLLRESKLIMWPVGNDEVYLYLGCSFFELQDILQDTATQKAVTMLFLSDDWWKSSDVYQLVCQYPLFTAFGIHELIRYNGKQYEYTHDTSFSQLIQHHEESRPDAEFMPRPSGCEWCNLNLQIRTSSHHDYIGISKDVLIAWYEDHEGKQIGKKVEKRIGLMKKLCRNNKATLMGQMLKQYAAHAGREFVTDEENKNLLHGTRKKLREFLCCQFGFSFTDFPITEEAKDVYRTEFSISFTDSKSDPHSPSRGACTQSIQQKTEYM